jgi:tetratricopeptide (TPR) repeat protein
MEQQASRMLRGREIAITGRLASMSRDEAVRCIETAGGRYVELPGGTTDFVVVGSDGPPLGRDGRPTQALRLAHDLQQRGHEIEIIDESRFITLLGLLEHGEDLHRLYTIAQLSRILEVPLAELRGWVRQGLIQPVEIVKRLCYFDFRQVATARRLHQLTRSGVTAHRIRKSLEHLAEWIGDHGEGLAQLEPLARGGRVQVRLADGRTADPSGQLHLDFESRDASGASAAAKPVAAPILRPRQISAEEWFSRGIAAEESGELDAAVEAYQKALSLGQPQPEVCFNLGNTYYALDRNVEAAACFIQATEIDPDYVEAWNNLGNAFAEIGKHDQAIPAYQRALAIEPGYADAHYNLGETLAQRGDIRGARQHWEAYLKQDPRSQWAMRVRRRLLELP